jgi:hypothetical protein
MAKLSTIHQQDILMLPPVFSGQILNRDRFKISKINFKAKVINRTNNNNNLISNIYY